MLGGSLAPGWVPVKDQSSGDTYYWNQQTNETTWDRPVAVEPPPETLPALRRTSAARSVNVAPGAAAAAAARTRGLARSGSLANSPTCSQRSGHSADLPPLHSPLGPAAGTPNASRQPAGSPTSGGRLTSPPATPVAGLRLNAAPQVGGQRSSDVLSSVEGELGPSSRTHSTHSAAAAAQPAARSAGPCASEAANGAAAHLKNGQQARQRNRDPAAREPSQPTSPTALPGMSRGRRTSDPQAARIAAARAAAAAQANPSRAAPTHNGSADASGGAAPSDGAARSGGCGEAAGTLERGLKSYMASLGVASAAAAAGARARATVAAGSNGAAVIPSTSAGGAGRADRGAGAGGAAAPRAKLLPGAREDSSSCGGVGAPAGAARAMRRAGGGGKPVVVLGRPVSRPMLLGSLALLCCLLLLLLVAIIAGSAAAGRARAHGPPTAEPPRLVYAGQHAALLSWEQQAAPGTFAASYEVELVRGAVGGQAVDRYEGLRSSRLFTELPERASLCARVRLSLRAEVSGAPVESLWSECLAIQTTGPAVPQPPDLQPSSTSASSITVQWAPPMANGAPLISYELQHSKWQFAQVDACDWTGPTCALGCAPLSGSKGGGSNVSWVQSGTRLAAVWEHCTGANAVGCCGPFCWCYDRQCCHSSREFAEVPFAASLSVHAQHGGALATADLDVASAGAAHAFTARARAQNAFGWSRWSAPLRVGTDAVGAGAPAPVDPPLFEAAPTAVRLSWVAPATNGAALLGYEIELHEASARAGAPPFATARAPHDATQLVVDGLAEAQRYHAVIRARNSVGETPWSEAVIVTSHEMRPPAAPEGLGVETTYMDAVAVQWPAVRDATASVTGYEVQWTLPHRAGDEGAWRRGCAVGQIDGVGFRALLSALSAEQLDDLRDALRAPRCTVDGLPLHARVVLRARTHSLAGRGPWGGHLGAETLGPRPCASITDQRRIWAGTFSNELQTCSADCWGQPQCTVHCLQGVEVSGQCARCFGAAVACTKSECHSACAWSATSGGCRDCAAKSCWPQLSECAGSEVPRDVL